LYASNKKLSSTANQISAKQLSKNENPYFSNMNSNANLSNALNTILSETAALN
jgi:hypothetical protein